MKVDPPIEKSRGFSPSECAHANPSIARPLAPGSVSSCVQLNLGFQISMSPFDLPTASRKPDGDIAVASLE